MAAPQLRQALTAALAALVALAALAAAGCGQGTEGGISGGGKVIGRTVTIYSLISDPAGANRDFVDGEKLALADAGGRAGELAVNFTSLDLGGDDEKLQGQSVRRAIADPQIIAAVGDATDITVPLFNAAGILQIAPGGDVALASDPHALPSGRRTVATLPAVDAPAGFDAGFRRAYGRDASERAREGYRAMAGALKAIGDAGSGGTDRTRVIDAYFG
jgi:hypothetical protein